MTYRLFYTDVMVSQSAYEAQKPHLSPYVYHQLDDAFGMAREINTRGGVAWEIENDDGPAFTRDQIAEQVLARRVELVDRPRVR